MRWTRIAVLGSMIGCSYPSLAPVAGEPVDALAGPPVDDRTCFGTGRFEVCLTAPPASEVAISTNTAINTDSSPMCTSTTATAAGYCVIAAADLTVSAKLAAIGSRPLVLLASHTLAVTKTGTVDVGSHVNQVGAGADPMACMNPTPVAGFSTAGGTGGSFFGPGGPGGTGDSVKGSAPGGTVAFIAQMRGGCPGGHGSSVFTSGSPEAKGGHGGGAVYLIAGGAVDVAGAVLATGQGGDGGPFLQFQPGIGTIGGGSGGGGGAGGMIGLDAPTVTASGLLLASGGGGGGGGYSASGSAGKDPTGVAAAAGGAGDPSSDGVAVGGAGSTPSSPTAPGSSGHDAIPTDACTTPAGAGGGGGGAGVIYAPASAKLTNLSPPATVP